MTNFLSLEQSALESVRLSELKMQLIDHEVLAKFRTRGFDRGEVTFILGQYWYPLRNFPHFLAGLIFKTEIVELQAFVSKILFQELGEGNPERAHSGFYTSTMTAVGLNVTEIIHAPPLPATAALVRCYNDSLEESYLAGLGSLYGTEVSDLQIVSSIGEAVKRATGAEQLPWVDIHVEQEPDHIENVDLALSLKFNRDDSLSILRAADKMWSSWIDFFESIGKRLEI